MIGELGKAYAAVTMTIPGVPVPCARPRTVRQAGRAPRTIMPARTVEYERHVRLVAMSKRPPRWSLDWRYSVRLTVYRARRAGDWDNLAKSVCDGLNGVLWNDDAQIFEAHVRLEDADPSPRVVLFVEGFEQ